MNPFPSSHLLAVAMLATAVPAPADEAKPEVELIRVEHEVRQIEGWTVHVDVSLLKGDHKEYFAEMTETFFTGNDYFPFNHYQLYHEHRPSYDLLARVWGSDIRPPKADDKGQPGILELRILATLMSQRGEFDEALALVAQARERSSDAEGRLAGLQKMIEGQRAEAAGEEGSP